MLVIRLEQLQAFEKPLLDGFIEEAAAYAAKSWEQLAAEYPNQADWRAFVTNCIRRGRALKFRDRGHLLQLLDWECEFGANFVERPEWRWLRSILISDLEHASRIHRIKNRLRGLRDRGEL